MTIMSEMSEAGCLGTGTINDMSHLVYKLHAESEIGLGIRF